MKRSLRIVALLWTLFLTAPSARSEDFAYHFISLLKEGGRREEYRATVRGGAKGNPTEMRWEDLSRRMWLPPLGQCKGETGQGGTIACSVSLRDAQLSAEGRVLIEAGGGRPLAAQFRFVWCALPSPWDVARGVEAMPSEIDVAWSIIP